MMKIHTSTQRRFAALATPLIVSNILSAASSFIPMYFIAQLNEEALAAGAIISSTYGLIMMLSVSMLYPVSIMVGQHHAAEQSRQVGAIVFSGTLIALITGLVLTAVLLNITRFFLCFEQPLVASHLAGDYFRGLGPGMIPVLLAAVFTQLFMGLSKSRLIFFFSLMTVIVTVVLSYLFIFDHAFFGGYGVYGAGLATSIAACIHLLFQLIYIRYSKDLKACQLFNKSSFNPGYLKAQLQMGLAISLQYGLELLAFAVVTYLIGRLGTPALAAQQISLQWSMLAIMMVMGFSQAAAILTSQAYGKKDLDELLRIKNTALLMGLASMTLLAFFLIGQSKGLISFYIDTHNPENEALLKLSMSILFLAAFTQIFDAGRNISAGILRGRLDTSSSMKTSVLSCWLIGLPLASLLGFVFNYGAIGIRFGMMIGIMVGCLQLIHKLYKTRTPDPGITSLRSQ